jgi:hypothetical protein
VIRIESIYFVKCDVCGSEDHDNSIRSAMEARIQAATRGWRFLNYAAWKVLGRKVDEHQRHYDECPKCRATH